MMEKLICEVLTCYSNFNGDLHDDTLLEKFENLVQSCLTSNVDGTESQRHGNIEKPVREFLISVTSCEQVQPEKLVLALKLGTGLILCTKESKEMDLTNFMILMEKCLKTKHWHEPSVRNAWLYAVFGLVKHEPFPTNFASNTSKYTKYR